MSITIENIFKNLSNNFKVASISQEQQEIRTIKFILNHQKEFERNTLYIGKTTFIEKKCVPSIPAFIGINDGDIPTDQLSQYFGNYALLKEECHLFEVFNSVEDMIDRNQRFEQSSSALLQILIKGRGLQYIIDMGYNLLNNPILLVDASYKLLAYTKNDDVDDLVWKELVTKGYCSYDLVSTFKKEGVVKKIALSGEPIFTNTGFSVKIHRIHGKIIINNQLVGYLGVLEYNQKFKEEDYKIIMLLCDVISTEMKKNNQVHGFMYESVLVDLLDNTIHNSKHACERLKTAGLTLEKYLYVMVINLDPMEKSNHHLSYFLRNYIDSLFRCSRSIFYENQIVTLLSLKENKIEKIKSKMNKCLKDHGLKAGISARFTNIINLQNSYHQAQSALELGNGLFNSQKLYYYPDFRIYHLLKLARDKQEWTNMHHSVPLELKRYDEQMKTEFFNTLYIYLATNKNSKLSAEKLYIHRNTLNYRLNKIFELTTFNQESFEESVQVYLTYKMLEWEEKEGR